MEAVNNSIDRSPAHRKLTGRRIVITRARSQAHELARRLEELGAEVIEFPTIEIHPPENYAPLDEAIKNLADYNWIIFTSVNGVKQFLDRQRVLMADVRSLTNIKIAAIGPETANRLQSAGIAPCLVPTQFSAEGILQDLRPEEMHGKRVLLPRAAGARDVLPETLRVWGAQVDVVETYRTALPNTDNSALRKLLQEKKIDMITFTSSSTVRHFCLLFRGENLRELMASVAIACIGPITEKTVEEKGLRAAVVSQEYTIPGLVRAMIAYFSGDEDRANRRL